MQPDTDPKPSFPPGRPGKQIVVIFLLLTIVIAAIGAASFNYLSGARHKHVNEQLTAVADLKAKQVEDWLEERRIDIREFVGSPFFIEAFRGWYDSRGPRLRLQVLAHMESTRKAHGYVSIELLDLQGAHLISSGNPLHEGAAHQDLLRRAVDQDGPLFIDLHRESGNGSIHLAYMIAVRDESEPGKPPVGIAVFTIDPKSHLYPLIQSWPTPSASGEVVIVRREGDEIVFLNELRHRKNTAFEIRFPLSKQDLPGARALTQGPRPYEGRDYRGVPVLTASRPIAGTPWMLGAKIDRDEALRDIYLLGLADAVLALAAIVVSGLLLVQVWRRQRLREALDRAEQARALNEERKLIVEFLRLVNESQNEGEMVKAAATFFQKQSGCEAVGIRLREENDYPYYEASGFPGEFVLLENSLCARDKAGRPILDSIGDPVLECMCGNVICGRFDPSKPFFTPVGSFWTNSTTELLATTTDADRQTRTRNRCHGEGYESVALIGLHVGDKRLGLLQLNDRQKGRFSPEVISLWERLAGYLAVALAKFKAEEELQSSEEFYRSLFDNMLNGFAYCQMLFDNNLPVDFVYLNVNKSFETLTGLKDVIGMKVSEVIPGIRESDPEVFEIYGRVVLTGRPERFEIYVKALKAWFWISVYSPKKDHFVAVFDVITEQKKIEAQLRQAQKMEAIGTLAGGIAHDFNNILNAVIGYGHLLHMKIKEDDPLRMNVEQILEAADRATTLTHSLLAFSRNQIISVKPIEVNELIRRVDNFLRRVIGEDISIRTALGEAKMTVMADSGQIEQVLMNLATNARDAMPHGGTFTLESGCIELDESFVVRHGYGKPGMYALLTATDTGKGMDEETKGRIFEPFFTTKELGRGTGLGLSVVYGIVKQHSGFIDVYSEPGSGSTFRIYLPLVNTPEEAGWCPIEAPAVSSGGTGTILLAEDDAALRKLGRIVLEGAGYTVITAEDGEEAVQKFIEHKDEVKLVILDMIMPQKSGREAYEQIRNIRPDIKALFASGYTADKVHREGMLETGFELLLKPVSPRDLLKKVREVLDR